MDLEAAFAKRLPEDMDPDGCWIWQGARHASGYGQVEIRGDDGSRVVWLAHRLSHFLVTGDRPEQVHHRCHVKACVNPEHLEAMTLVEHQAAHHPRLQQCKRGHDLTDPENVYIRPDGKGRGCLPCGRQRAVANQRRYRARRL